MAARISLEELRPVSAKRAERSARVRRRFQGARVQSAGRTLEPREAGGILDAAIEGLLARLGPCLVFALAVWLPFGQVEELLGFAQLEGLAGDLGPLLINALGVVPLALSGCVVVSLVGDALVDPKASVSAGILRGLARAPGALVLLLITQVVTLPLVFLCVAPYFVAQWMTWAALPIYVLEGEALLSPSERARARANPLAYLLGFPLRISRSILRSMRLSKGGPSLGRWVLLAIVGQLVLGGMLELAATGLNTSEAREYLRAELGFTGATADMGLGAVAALFTALSACVRSALMVAFYLDLRVRREGWDLELALERAEKEASPAVGAA